MTKHLQMTAQPEGTTIQFKFTLGSWNKVEKGASGEEINNRIFTFGNGDTVHLKIFNWSNGGGGGGSTAAENVHIMDENFFMPQLNRTRRIWIYLPPGYEQDTLHYPVLYMHDGQNLFDQSTSFAGEWEVDETLNRLSSQGKEVPIVVGIDNGGTYRISELTPWVNQQYGGGQGGLCMDFIVQTLKPFVDEHYRTLTGRKNTAIAGSSLGGLISHYGVLMFRNIFSKAAVFSPSFWFSDSVWSFVKNHPRQLSMRMYLLCGSAEEEPMVSDMLTMKDSLLQYGYEENDLKTKVVAGGQHNEKLWRESFEAAYLWLFDDYVNGVPIHRISKAVRIFPNPVGETIHLKGYTQGNADTLTITDVSGRIMMEQSPFKSIQIKVCGLPPGVYFLQIKTNGTVYNGQFVKQ